MEIKSEKEKELDAFQKSKIKSLNKFFMKNVSIGAALLILVYILSLVFLFVLVNNAHVNEGLRISILSMIATFILTTSKSVIDKIIAVIQYIISLLAEEQRGFSEKMGIEIDKVEFEDTPENKDSEVNE